MPITPARSRKPCRTFAATSGFTGFSSRKTAAAKPIMARMVVTR